MYPSSYLLRQERNVPTFGSAGKKSEYQLTLEPVLGEGTDSFGVSEGWGTLSPG